MKKKSTTFSRRDFVKATVLSSAGIMIVPRHVLGGPGYIAPSDRVNLGFIGAGGKGKQNVQEFIKMADVDISAIADPAYYWNLADFYYRSEAGRGPTAEMIEDFYEGKGERKRLAQYDDFRKMMEKSKDLDAIVCSTPDHTHAYITLMALKMGKHVYCEKPLTHNIWEAREVAKITKETGLITQMGNSGHAADGIRETVEYLRAGVIGEVKECHVWVPAGRWLPGLHGIPQGESTMPVGFDWNQWLGPREIVPFHENYVPVTWRDFWDYGCGALGDFGCHDLDAVTWAYDLQSPDTVQVFPAGYSDSKIAPYGEIGYFNFAAKGNQKAMKINWYSGGLKPELHSALPIGFTFQNRSAMYVGTKGVIVTDGGDRTPQIFSESLRNNIKTPKPSIERSSGHFREWIDAIKKNKPSAANFEYGSRLTEITLLGVLSLRMKGKLIEWDSAAMKAKGLPEADQYIQEPVRKGWEM
jgi:predicted dehydrogenase